MKRIDATYMQELKSSRIANIEQPEPYYIEDVEEEGDEEDELEDEER